MIDNDTTLINDVSETQGNLFEYIAENGYDLEDFAIKFMIAEETAYMLDVDYCIHFYDYPEQLLSYYAEDIRNPKLADESCDIDLAYWLGYSYRFLTNSKKLKSKDVIMKLPPKKMIACYPAYHTFLNDELLLEALYEDYLKYCK